jgi:N-methylhydantoinase A
MSYTIGIDIGGTFTDFIVKNGRGITLEKVLSTPADPSAAVLTGLKRLAERQDLDLDDYLGQVDRIVHGTTIADNALIQGKGVATGLLTTDGFRDELVLRRGYKEDIWDPRNPPPPDIVPRRRRLGVVERMAADGEVVVPLDEESARTAIRRLKLQDVSSVAIATLFSYVNPAHEERLAELVTEEMPDVEVSLSHQVMPKAPEFERVSTTVLNAYVGPLVTNYLDRIVERLGPDVRLLIMQSGGGAMTREYMRRRPIQVLASGPAGGVIGCAAAGRAKEHHDLLCVDMGGTSYDVSLVTDGVAPSEPGWNWHHRFLCGLPMIKVETLGAGGGSIAHVRSGALEVGPQSAGSEPGPICYGGGGDRPTVTDANLLLGLLSADFAGGRMELSLDGVEEAFVEQIATPLGLESAAAAAAAVRRVVNANMNHAVRRLTAERGVDPTTLTMLAYGGNGPVHACVQAEDLGIDRVVVSRQSAAFSAFGLLAANPTIDEERSYLTSAPDPDHIKELWGELVDRARGFFADGGFDAAQLHQSFELNFRYPGQNWSLAVPVAERVGDEVGLDWFDADAFVVAVDKFHEIHEREHTYARRDETPELTSVRAIVSVPVSHPDLGGPGRAESVQVDPSGSRRADLGAGFESVDIYAGPTLGPGATVRGPAIVEEPFTTIVVNDGWVATVDLAGDYMLERGGIDG